MKPNQTSDVGVFCCLYGNDTINIVRCLGPGRRQAAEKGMPLGRLEIGEPFTDAKIEASVDQTCGAGVDTQKIPSPGHSWAIWWENRLCRCIYSVVAALVVSLLGVGCTGGASAIWFRSLPCPELFEPTNMVPRVFLLDSALLVKAKHRLTEGDEETTAALTRLTKSAERALSAGPFTVTDNPHLAASGDPHDYHSIMIYAWPNPWTGKPYYIRDGKRNPELHEYDLPRVNRMVTNVRTLALAYYFTEDPRFAERAVSLLRTWFLDPETRMNPNLRYAQAIPGLTSGTWIGIIEGMRIPRDAIDVIGLIQPSAAWNEEDQAGMEAWCADYLEWLRSSLFGRLEHRARNNHGTWYDVQVVILALFLDDIELAREVLTKYAPRRLYRQIKPDGSQPRELARADPLAYTRYNLEAWLNLASLGKRAGVDLWNYTGPGERSIRRTLEYMYQEFPDAPMFFLQRVEVEFDPDRKWLDQRAPDRKINHAEGLQSLLFSSMR